MRVDVVIVGAGAAGCVMAARLSERRERSVLLLEAGAEGDVTPWPDLAVVRTAQQAPSSYVVGLGLGGSAALNGMVMTVGEPADYDEWEHIYGCVGWSWRDVRPWFRRAALPMRRAPRRELGSLSAAMLSAADGAERARLSRTKTGGRASVREVYLDPARHRPNLRVRANALVDRVLFDGRTAVGVALADGEVIEAETVVLSAGALQTPAVLLRSDVDREGVGHGLHDHPSLSVPLTLHSGSGQESALPVTVVAHASHVARNDLQIVAVDTTGGPSLLAAAMRVYSRGQVRLAPSTATTTATTNTVARDLIIEFNMLSDERDLDLLRAAALQIAKLGQHQNVLAVGTLGPVPNTDDSLRGSFGDYFHAAGSCRMGAVGDAKAVVDARCHVIGYQSLVVCDASVMPNLPRANPCLPTVMIAERVSAMLDAKR